MTLDRNQLWAKSKRDDEPERSSMRLLQHLKDVHAAAEAVLDATAADQLQALGLDPCEYGERFQIEEGFLDEKSGLFELEASKLRDVKSLERLVMVISVAIRCSR